MLSTVRASTIDSGSAATLAGPSAPGSLIELPTVDPAHYVGRVPIARGGMGQIIAARDRRLDRRVAIKELRTQSPELRARFEREIQLTARLQHPSIVSIHEAGRWPSGEPFYAMKLVPGRSLDQVVDDATTFEQRLALLPHVLAVADALAYAHGQRVIHRDLKPHNVLVGEFGETVVIDWGLAKDLASGADALPRDATARVEPDATTVGEVLGTPAYMPPDQADGQPVDERADVYAIGALLYFVLTGRAPYTGATTHAVIFAVVEGPPVALELRQPDVPPDLLAIVRRAMSREPTERYPTARELAEDLRRYSTGQLVGAHRYSLSLLLRRWGRRHRAPLLVAAIAAVAMICVGIVSVARIIREERRATAQQALAERSRADAERHRDFMLGDLRTKLEAVGKLELLGEVAREMRVYYQFRPATADLDERRKHAQAAHNLGDVLRESGDLGAAMVEYRAALALRAALATDTADPAHRRELADSHTRIGDVLIEHGDLAAGLTSYRQGLEITRALRATAPANLMWQRDEALGHQKVGDVLLEQGQLVEALAEYRAGRDLLLALVAHDPDHAGWLRGLSVMHENVADVLRVQGALPDALDQQRAALAIAERLLAQDPANAVYVRDLAICHSKVGNLLRSLGKLEEALVRYRAALALATGLAERDPSNADWQRGLAISHAKIGSLLFSQGELAGALAAHRTALAIRIAQAATHRTNPSWQRELVESHDAVGDVLTARGDRAGARVVYRAALPIAQALALRDPANATWQLALAGIYTDLGETEAARPILTSLLAKDPSNTEVRNRLTALDRAR